MNQQCKIQIFKQYLVKYAGIGVGLSSGFVASALLAVTISGTINTFSSGDQLDSAKINENFASLRTSLSNASSVQNTAFAVGGASASACPLSQTCFTYPYFQNSAPTSEISLPIPRSGTVQNIYTKCISNSLNSTINLIFRKNGVDTNLSHSISAGSTASLSNTTGSLSITKGDEISIKFSSSASSGQATCFLFYEL